MFPTAHGVVSQGGKDELPEPGDGYRYYRLLISQHNGGTLYVGTHTLQLRATIGGPDLPTTKGGTATASSTTSTRSPEDAFDGDSGTGWIGNASDLPVAWLQFDFGAGNEQVVAEYAVGAYPTSTQTAARSPNSWSLLASNDLITWATLDIVSGETGWVLGETRVFTL